MKVLVTGASGLLGHDVWKVFDGKHELIGLGRTQPVFVPTAQWRPCDLTEAAKVYTIVTRENPDLIVHCAAYNNVDGAESHPEEAYRQNTYGTRNLALACQRFDTVLMAVSTDSVFGGDDPPEKGYREFDIPHPLGVYAHSKRWGEILVEQLLTKFYIVRTSWLFGPGRPTFVDKALELARDGKPVPCLEDMVSSPTYTPDLAQAMCELAESAHYGIYHLSNSGFCSRVDLIREVLKIHRIPEAGRVVPQTQAELKLPAKRPVFSGLECLAWALDGHPPLRSWKDALRAHFTPSKVTAL